MPKINIYLPDDLAELVRQTGMPVSAICQRALEHAVRRVTAVRAAAAGNVNNAKVVTELSQFTERARSVLALAIGQARTPDTASVETRHLLGGLLADGSNLAVHILRAVDVDPEQLSAVLARQAVPEPPGAGDGTKSSRPFSLPAAKALELAVAEAVSLDHDYVGCEHLLLGLAAEPDGAVGQALRGRGAELRVLRRELVAALAGSARHQPGGEQAGTPQPDQLKAIMERLERLEKNLGI